MVGDHKAWKCPGLKKSERSDANAVSSEERAQRVTQGKRANVVSERKEIDMKDIFDIFSEGAKGEEPQQEKQQIYCHLCSRSFHKTSEHRCSYCGEVGDHRGRNCSKKK